MITMISQAADDAGVLSDEKHYPLYQNLAFAGYAFTEYFVKCLVPINISYMYPFPNPIGQTMPAWYWIYPFALILVAVLLRQVWKNKLIMFGVLFFSIHIGLALHIIPIARFAIVADRYVYISSIGVFFLLAYFFNRALMMWPAYNKIIITSCFTYILSLSVYTYVHSSISINLSIQKRLKTFGNIPRMPRYLKQLLLISRLIKMQQVLRHTFMNWEGRVGMKV